MDAVEAHREAAQPIRDKTGGSTFTNPPGNKAWQLIDAAGCRGLRIGGAMVSEKHCNFLINVDNATGHDLERLGETVRARVLDTSGVRLEWEIKRVGRFADGETVEPFLGRVERGPDLGDNARGYISTSVGRKVSAMGINIKNPETVRLIRELAELTGKGQTEAVTEAVRERIERLRRSEGHGATDSWRSAAKRRRCSSRPRHGHHRSRRELSLRSRRRACRSDRRHVGAGRDHLEASRTRSSFRPRWIDADSVAMSAANYLEAGIVIDGSRDPVLSRAVDDVHRRTRHHHRTRHRTPGPDRPRGVSRFRQGERPSGRAELRRLLRLCAGQGSRRTAPLQGRRLRENRRAPRRRLTRRQAGAALPLRSPSKAVKPRPSPVAKKS